MTASNTAESASDTKFIITRVFDAPRDLMWRAWTEADRLAQWWGPKGFSIKVSEFDFRPGGSFHYCMLAGNGHTMWGKFLYREITAPERITFVNCFSNEAGEVVRAPFFNGKWPLEIHNTLTLVESDGKTTLTLTGGPINPTEEERKAFEANFASMRQGFAGTFEKLSEHLSKM